MMPDLNYVLQIKSASSKISLISKLKTARKNFFADDLFEWGVLRWNFLK